MDYVRMFEELPFDRNNPLFSHRHMRLVELFYSWHKALISYVFEEKSWYTYTGKKWEKDYEGLFVMGLCNNFVDGMITFANNYDGEREMSSLSSFPAKYDAEQMRTRLVQGTKNLARKSIASFDQNVNLINCQNGTLNLETFILQPHNPEDYIMQICGVTYDINANTEQWEHFIDEIMLNDKETARYLQKALGYCLTGKTWLEKFFIFYGMRTRNGKGTLSETIRNVLGDYGRTAQAPTFAHRPRDGAAASPDIARLKGARYVNSPEPDKTITLNAALDEAIDRW
ncbi:hypothetical protein AGMMS49992_11610 [Clostridia bacterium]|nr:hypothetical protein AGMMS49992_11610 [Clostridia bacterium]